MKRSLDVDRYIDEASPSSKETLAELREMIISTVPNCQESFKWSQPVYSSEKNFCYLRGAKNHVNLGFFSFDKVDDPNGLLEGTGATMRHIKIKDLNAVDMKTLSSMVAQAASN